MLACLSSQWCGIKWEKKMENDMEAGIRQGFIGITYCRSLDNCQCYCSSFLAYLWYRVPEVELKIVMEIKKGP